MITAFTGMILPPHIGLKNIMIPYYIPSQRV